MCKVLTTLFAQITIVWVPRRTDWTGKCIIVLHTHCKNLTGSCLFIHWACSLFSFFFSELFSFPSSRVQIIPPKFRFCLSLVLQFPCLFQFATVCGNHFSSSPSAPCGVISSRLLSSATKRRFVLCNYRLEALLTDAGMSLCSKQCPQAHRPSYTGTHTAETQFFVGTAAR